MQVSRVSQQNNTNFNAIRYVNKGALNKQALEAIEAIENASVLKSIEKKYPNAAIIFDKFYDHEDETHTLLANIKLAKNKNYRWTLSSHREEVPNEHFINFIKTASLEEIENNAVEKLDPIASVTIIPKTPSLIDRIKKYLKSNFK